MTDKTENQAALDEFNKWVNGEDNNLSKHIQEIRAALEGGGNHLESAIELVEILQEKPGQITRDDISNLMVDLHLAKTLKQQPEKDRVMALMAEALRWAENWDDSDVQKKSPVWKMKQALAEYEKFKGEK